MCWRLQGQYKNCFEDPLDNVALYWSLRWQYRNCVEDPFKVYKLCWIPSRQWANYAGDTLENGQTVLETLWKWTRCLGLLDNVQPLFGDLNNNVQWCWRASRQCTNCVGDPLGNLQMALELPSGQCTNCDENLLDGVRSSGLSTNNFVWDSWQSTNRVRGPLDNVRTVLETFRTMHNLCWWRPSRQYTRTRCVGHPLGSALTVVMTSRRDEFKFALLSHSISWHKSLASYELTLKIQWKFFRS